MSSKRMLAGCRALNMATWQVLFPLGKNGNDWNMRLAAIKDSIKTLFHSLRPRPQTLSEPPLMPGTQAANRERQRLIVRQSCLKAAVEFNAQGVLGTVEDTLRTADEFVKWVNG
jgi:hypothetical protein